MNVVKIHHTHNTNTTCNLCAALFILVPFLLDTMSGKLALSLSKKILSQPSCRHLNTVCITRKQSVGSSFAKRYLNSTSWASDKLQEAGEKIEKGPEQVSSEVTSDMLSTPSPKVQKLVDEVLTLNVVEVNQLIRSIQVIYIM